MAEPADVRATEIESGAAGTQFTLSGPFGTAPIALPLLGDFNVSNALCAATVAHAVGVELPAIVQGLMQVSAVPGLLARVDAGQPFVVLIDEGKTATQLVSALEVARQLAADHRVIVLVGGSDLTGWDQMRRKGQVAELLADYAVFTSQDPRFADPDALLEQIAQGARAAGGRAGETFSCIVDRREAIRHALETAQPGDCVLLAGKGAEDEFTIGAETQGWDEGRVARAALAELGFSAHRSAISS
jgi:UDP-N-acetylmuramoyl-L-alanyl-D-glutamate--2,6-diaminopimelate ligase